MQRVVTILIILAFLIAISLPAFFVNLFGETDSNAGKGKLLNLPELIDANGRWKADATTQFSDWFGKNLGFRTQLFSIYNFVEFKLFRILSGKDVDTGQNNGRSHTTDDFAAAK
jgi:hypothetical protein